MRLRASLAAAALLGLGGMLAPGYAQEAVPAAVAAPGPAADASPPPSEPADDNAGVVPDSASTNTAATDSEQTWQQVGAGIASWYGAGFAGHRTASGERFDPAGYTAAHRTLPFGTRVRVTNAQGDSVIVRINDRGPYTGHRVIDLSQAAARNLGITRTGSGRVTLAVLDQ